MLRLLLVIACLASVASSVAAAERRCFPEDQFTATLATEHGELPLLAFRNSTTERAMVLFASPDGTSWTAMIRVGRMLCGGFSGDAWEFSAAIEGDPS